MDIRFMALLYGKMALLSIKIRTVVRGNLSAQQALKRSMVLWLSIKLFPPVTAWNYPFSCFVFRPLGAEIQNNLHIQEVRGGPRSHDQPAAAWNFPSPLWRYKRDNTKQLWIKGSALPKVKRAFW
jgi:hypothetical protein